MGWAACASAAALLALLAACWWGSNVVFDPAHKTPLRVRPADLGLPCEDAAFETPDGVTLRGWLIPAAAPTDASVILCHGWSDNKGDMLARFRFLQRDFNLFLFDSRGHGESSAPIGTIGYLESVDFDAALRHLRAARPGWCRRLGVVGLSMGAAMGIFALARHRALLCGVLESPFRSFNEVVTQFTTNRFALPFFPFVWLTLLVISLRLGDDPEPYSPIYHVGAIAPRPLLFISGEEDSLMPLAQVRAVYAAAGRPKQLWTVPGASHGRCQELAGAEYEARVRGFLLAHLGAVPAA